VKLQKVTRFLVLISLIGGLPLSAQQKKAPQIRLEDPELYYAFFRAHVNVDLKIQSSAAAAAAQVSSSTAAVYRISPNDLPKLTDEIRKFNVSLGDWFSKEQYYLAQQRAARKRPDIKVLVNYQWQRQRLVMNTHAAIHDAVTGSSWTGLNGYINGDFKTAQSQGKGAAK